MATPAITGAILGPSAGNAALGLPGNATPPSAYAPVGAGSQNLIPAIQTIWSKEILFQAMPILRFEQFAVKKTELGVQPGLSVKMMRYNNLDAENHAPLVEGVRMTTDALTASQYQITVTEQGKALAVSELLLNASFDDVMASASRLLGRHMAQYLDFQSRDVIRIATNTVFGRTTVGYSARTVWSPYDRGFGPSAAAVAGTDDNALRGASYDDTPNVIGAPNVVKDPTSATGVNVAIAGANGRQKLAAAAASYMMSPATVKDAVEVLATRNIPRLGETYVAFVHPHQSRQMRDWPEWIEVTKYAAPGNFMLGEVGRFNDVVFIETTQTWKGKASTTFQLPGEVGYVSAGTGADIYQGMMIGDNAFGHAVSLPVELRDGGVLDFGREHALAWYAIWGMGLITNEAVVIMETN